MNNMVNLDKVLAELETLMRMGDAVAQASVANDKYTDTEKSVAAHIGDNFSFALKMARDQLIRQHEAGNL